MTNNWQKWKNRSPIQVPYVPATKFVGQKQLIYQSSSYTSKITILMSMWNGAFLWNLDI